VNTVRLRKRIPMSKALNESRDNIDRETARPNGGDRRSPSFSGLIQSTEKPEGRDRSDENLRRLRKDFGDQHHAAISGKITDRETQRPVGHPANGLIQSTYDAVDIVNSKARPIGNFADQDDNNAIVNPIGANHLIIYKTFMSMPLTMYKAFRSPLTDNNVNTNDAVDNINRTCTQERPTGTSADQALRKLRADAPSLHRRVLAGELSPLPEALQQIRAFTAQTGQPIGAAS